MKIKIELRRKVDLKKEIGNWKLGVFGVSVCNELKCTFAETQNVCKQINLSS